RARAKARPSRARPARAGPPPRPRLCRRRTELEPVRQRPRKGRKVQPRSAARLSQRQRTGALKTLWPPFPDGSPIIVRKLWLNDGESPRRPGDGLALYALATVREFELVLSAPAREGEHAATALICRRGGTANNDAHERGTRGDAIPTGTTAAEEGPSRRSRAARSRRRRAALPR